MPSVVKKENQLYTYADILQWDDGERWELLDGEAYMMSYPSRVHQEILGALFCELYTFFERKTL